MVNSITLSTDRYICALREGDFLLHIQVSDKLVEWFHAFDHMNYARWMSVYLKDMVQLKDCHPDIFK